MAARRRKLIAGICLAFTVGVWAAIASQAEEAKPQAQINLSIVSKAETSLSGATVRDRQGAEIGRVHGLTRGVDGEIKTVQVARTESGRANGVIALDARDMVYLPQENAILTPVNRATAATLPAISQ
jgi:hypothetical protein